MGTGHERDNPNQSQSQTQSPRPKDDDLSKRPREFDKVGSPTGRPEDLDPDRDRSGYGRSGVNDEDPDAVDDDINERDRLAERDRQEELKRQQRDQEG